MKKGTLAFLLFIIGVSCNTDTPEPSPTFVDQFYSNASNLEILVAYEEDAEPYTEFNNKQSWDISENNINSLLSGKGINLTVPKVVGSMQYLGDYDQLDFTTTDLFEIAEDIQKYNNKSSDKGIVVLFLNGYFNKDGERLDRVLGLNINGTAILAMFKPVIESASPSFTIRTLVEQTTMTHEIAHALGLVDNGVPLTSFHHDEPNGAHCTNKDCVMYWQNGGANVVEFVQPYLVGGNIELFGLECLDDIAAM